MQRGLRIEQVATEVVRPVRMRVLRAGTPSDDPTFDGDDDADTVHLAAFLDEHLAAVSTWLPRPWVLEPQAPAWQLRGMATEAFAQGGGVGGALLEAGVARAQEADATIVWANARDTALAFYLRHGFAVAGDGFRTLDTDLPHHRIIRRCGGGSTAGPTTAARP